MADDKKTEAKGSETTELAREIAKALKEGIKEGLETGQAYAAERVVQSHKQTARNVPTGGACPECGQGGFTLTGFACQGKHEKLVLLPNRHQRYFPGCILNGVKYLSSNATHRVTVPLANDFRQQIQAWADYEDELSRGRDRNVGSSGGGALSNAVNR